MSIAALKAHRHLGVTFCQKYPPYLNTIELSPVASEGSPPIPPSSKVHNAVPAPIVVDFESRASVFENGFHRGVWGLIGAVTVWNSICARLHISEGSLDCVMMSIEIWSSCNRKITFVFNEFWGLLVFQSAFGPQTTKSAPKAIPKCNLAIKFSE